MTACLCCWLIRDYFRNLFKYGYKIEIWRRKLNQQWAQTTMFTTQSCLFLHFTETVQKQMYSLDQIYHNFFVAGVVSLFCFEVKPLYRLWIDKYRLIEVMLYIFNIEFWFIYFSPLGGAVKNVKISSTKNSCECHIMYDHFATGLHC